MLPAVSSRHYQDVNIISAHYYYFQDKGFFLSNKMKKKILIYNTFNAAQTKIMEKVDFQAQLISTGNNKGDNSITACRIVLFMLFCQSYLMTLMG